MIMDAFPRTQGGLKPNNAAIAITLEGIDVAGFSRRFWAKVDKSRNCWIWTAHVGDSGYGSMHVRRTPRPAHRVSWLLAYGNVPSKIYVLHKCDNRLCVRPDHLFLGTAKDNHWDMRAKGRDDFPRGERSHTAKINETIVLYIRALRLIGWKYAEICKLFGLSRDLVSNVGERRSWRHVYMLEEGI